MKALAGNTTTDIRALPPVWTIGLGASSVVLLLAIFAQTPLVAILGAKDANDSVSATAKLIVLAIGLLFITAIMAGCALYTVLRQLKDISADATAARIKLAEATDQLTRSESQLEYYASHTRRRSAITEHNLRADRFSRAVLQATGNSPSVRAVGLLALEDLVKEHEAQFAASAYEFLVSIIREQTRPTSGPTPVEANDHSDGHNNGLQTVPTLTSDVEAAFGILARNRDLFDRNIRSLAEDTAINGGTGVHLLNVDLSGARLRGLRLQGATFTNVRLNGAVITEAHFSGAVFTNVKATSSIWHEIDMSASRVSRMTLSNSTMTGVNLERAALHDVRLERSNLDRVSMDGANLATADFTQARLTQVRFEQGLLSSVVFRGCAFDQSSSGGEPSSFARSTLSGVDYTAAFLYRTGFGQAALGEVSFLNAHLEEVYLNSAALRQVLFNRATIVNSHFNDTHLASVSFESASIVDTPIELNDSVTSGAASTLKLTHPNGNNSDTNNANGLEYHKMPASPVVSEPTLKLSAVLPD